MSEGCAPRQGAIGTTQPRILPERLRMSSLQLNAEELSVIAKFGNAVHALYDIRTIHTDPNVANFRHDLRQTLRHNRSDHVVSEDLIRAAELKEIAKLVSLLFENTAHHKHAQHAATDTTYVFGGILTHCRGRFDVTLLCSPWTKVPVLDDSDHSSRTFLRRQCYRPLYWVHYPKPYKLAEVDADPSLDARSCLCPFSTYLQLILLATPLESWPAVPFLNTDESPVTMAWEWARTNHAIGKQTADVVVLITLGPMIYQNMVFLSKQAAQAEEKRRIEEQRRGSSFINSIPFLKSMWSAGSQVLIGEGSSRVSNSNVSSHRVDIKYERMPEVGSDDVRAAVRQALLQLFKAGDQYAQLLREKDVEEERIERCVKSIRDCVKLIVGKAEPPVPNIQGLGISGRLTCSEKTEY